MYTPILRCRQSEILAVRELSSEARNYCVPLLDLPAPSKKADQESAEAYTTRNIGRLKNALEGFNRVLIDSSELDPAFRLGAGKHPLTEASKGAALSGTVPIPVTGLHRDAGHLKAAVRVRNELSKGAFCVRLDLTDISTSTATCKALVSLLSQNSIATTDTILLLDLQSVLGQDASPLAAIVNRFLTHAQKLTWGGIIVAGYGIPDKLGEAVSVREQGYVPRTEQAIYRLVSDAIPLPNMWFGDYTTLSPTHVELDWRVLSKVMSPKATYTLDESWFVIRGGPFSSHAGGREQYYDIAAEIVALEEFSGPDFSFGDHYIQERADRTPGPGSPSSWIKACVNHHITLTAVAHAS